MSLSTCSITAIDGRSPKSNRVSKSRKARKQKTRALALHNQSQTITSTPSTSRSKGDDVQFVHHVVLLDPQIKDKDFSMVQAAHDWIQHHPKIKSAPRIRGGWERWVQMDLCLTLKSAGYDVKCEEKCFEDKRLRCDLLIHHPPPSDSEHPKWDRYFVPASTHSPICEYYDVVELKCQLMEESIEEFYTRFKKDIKKLLDKPFKEPLHNWTTQRFRHGSAMSDNAAITEGGETQSMARTEEYDHHVTDPEKPNNQSFDDFIELFRQKLPQEVIDEVEYWLYEMVFCPGYLYLHRQQRINKNCCVWPEKADIVARPALLGLSKAIKTKYQTRMWSENTWVISTGGLEETMAFLDQLPTEAKEKHICKVQLSFRTCDVDEGLADLQRQRHEEVLCAKKSGPRTYYYTDVQGKRVNSNCEQIWFAKRRLVKSLLLQHFLLDLSECYNLYGGFNGGSFP
ncbi:MAG: hypothetical protein Q9204_004067 [Flavoplaca sp. TL-2023a]